ncbi:MAG: 5'/3'-nucleotidase SurE [Schleiferiaceae bacterium]
MTKLVKPLILVTNDDGITSPGIRMLIKQMNILGDVVVVAPNSPQSGKSHAISISEPLRCDPIDIDTGPQIEYSCSGTPADCIKLAIHEILDRRPDIIVSGVNHGSNASVNVIYSGTMAAAIEGAMQGIPSIGFSILDYDWNTDFSFAEKYVSEITSKVIHQGLPNGVCLNVNIPKAKNKDYKGVRVCHQTIGKWEEDFDKRKDPFDKDYYWMSGEFKNQDDSKNCDIRTLENDLISIVPIQFDLTSHDSIDFLGEYFNK